jgi:hypothetical protein
MNPRRLSSDAFAVVIGLLRRGIWFKALSNRRAGAIADHVRYS